MCEPKRGLPWARILAAAAALLVLPLAAAVASSLAEAFALGVFAACGVSLAVLARLLRPAKRSARSHHGERIMARPALAAPPRAIEAARVVQGTVIERSPRTALTPFPRQGQESAQGWTA